MSRIIALWLSEQYLSVPGSIGFIALFSVSVLNGVLMVTSINQRITNTNNVEKAILEGANSRLRPVLMTALIGAFGLGAAIACNGGWFRDSTAFGNRCYWRVSLKHPADTAGYPCPVFLVFSWLATQQFM